MSHAGMLDELLALRTMDACTKDGPRSWLSSVAWKEKGSPATTVQGHARSRPADNEQGIYVFLLKRIY